LKDKRTKNFHREVADGALNQLIIHDDVPFFWDNWDIMHHTYETKVKKVQENLKSHNMTTTESSIILEFVFEISEKSKVQQ